MFLSFLRVPRSFCPLYGEHVVERLKPLKGWFSRICDGYGRWYDLKGLRQKLSSSKGLHEAISIGMTNTCTSLKSGSVCYAIPKWGCWRLITCSCLSFANSRNTKISLEFWAWRFSLNDLATGIHVPQFWSLSMCQILFKADQIVWRVEESKFQESSIHIQELLKPMLQWDMMLLFPRQSLNVDSHWFNKVETYLRLDNWLSTDQLLDTSIKNHWSLRNLCWSTIPPKKLVHRSYRYWAHTRNIIQQ